MKIERKKPRILKLATNKRVYAVISSIIGKIKIPNEV